MSMSRRGILLVVALIALLVAAPASAMAKRAPSPQKQAQSAFKNLLFDTRLTPKRLITKRHRSTLVRTAKRARKFSKRRPCKSIKTLRTYRKRLRWVRLRKIPGDVPGIGSFRSQLRSDLLRVNVALLQHPRARKCGGGKPSKVTSVSARVVRSDAKRLRIQISLPTPHFVGQQVGGTEYEQMLMDGMGETGSVGKPALPAVQKFFGVPLGADVAIHVNGTQGYTVPGVKLFPHQQPAVDKPVSSVPGAPDLGVFSNPAFDINSKAYKSNRKFPASPSSGDALGMMRDLRIGGVTLNGGQYRPKSGDLHVFTSIDVTVDFKGKNTGQFGDNEEFNSPWNHYFTKNYKGLVSNYGAVSSHLGDLTTRAPFCGEDMLIITSPALQPAAATLATARRNAGFDPRVVLTGAGAGAAGTTNAQIQQFIRGELNSKTCFKHPSYVILLGNTANVPTFLVECSPGKGFHPDPAHPANYCDIASDLPYSLDGNGSDLFADVELGRIPATDLTSANAVVNKIVNYENTMPAPANDDFYHHATVTGYFQAAQICVLNNGASGPPNCNPDAGAVNGHFVIDHTNRQDTRGFTKTSDTVLRAMKFNSYNVDRLWTTDDAQVMPERYYDGTAIPNNLRRPAFAWDASTTDFLNAYNGGRFLIFHRDHGWPGGWANPSLSSGDVASMTNGSKLPVVFGVNCASALFDNPASPSFVEQQIEKPSGGAVAGFGDTRNSPTWPNNDMALGFFDALFPTTVPAFGADDPTRKLGDVLLSGKNYMAAQNSGDSEYVEHYLYHLLGDPSMQMWAAAPQHFDPTRIASTYRAIAHVNPGDPVFQVNVAIGAGNPTPGGTVATLFSGERAIGRGIVGSDGKVTITPDDTSPPANLHVTFDQQGALPAQDTIDQAPQGQRSTMTIQCPTGGQAGGTYATTGKLTPVPAGATVHLHYAGPNNQAMDQDVTTNANNTWTGRVRYPSGGQWTVTATFDGDATFEGSTANCKVTISS